MYRDQFLLPYQTIRRFERTPMLFTEVVPVEYAISLPLPTRRWSYSAYAAFASPVYESAFQAPPDRWWVVDALSGNLVLFAYWDFLPFTSGTTWQDIPLPTVSGSMQQQKENQVRFEVCMDQLAPAFFFEQTPDEHLRTEVWHLLHVLLPESLLSQYHGLTPDFFAWLA